MRYIQGYIQSDLIRKMVFIGGPRQCGKTTLAKQVLQLQNQGIYLNWDFERDRKKILAQQWASTDQLIVLDELHKYPRWKNWIKGLYDKHHEAHQFLVTGSARLDIYRRGGDSLLGRYHYWRLHPFTLSEAPPSMSPQDAFKRLMTVGGFPEPFFDGSEQFARRFRRERTDRVLRDDIRDLEPLRSIPTLELFVEALRTRVGGMISLSNIAEDLQVSPITLKHWLEILERMYLIFVVRPWSRKLPRALVKAPKVYFFDNADVVGDDGARFENLVATSLLKRIHFLQDRDGYKYELFYIRDKEKREVDFAIARDNKLIELIEAKYSDEKPSPHLRYYAERLNPERAIQIVAKLERSYTHGKLQIETPFDSLAQPLISL